MLEQPESDRQPSIPNEIELRTLNAGRYGWLVVTGIIAGLLVFWALGRSIIMGKLVSAGLVSGVIIWIANRCRRDDKAESEQFSAARQGDYLYFWPLNKSQMTFYRTAERAKRRRRVFWFFVLPWIIGIGIAIVVGTYSIITGVSQNHSLQWVA